MSVWLSVCRSWFARVFGLSKMDFEKVITFCSMYSKPSVPLEYGTAGFRANATLLEPVACRVGILAGLRSMATGKVVGLMITASHNPEHDNGVKLIDPNGGMLDVAWEALATTLVNCELSEIERLVKSIISAHAIDVPVNGTVLLGWDTRPSSENLVKVAWDGISSIGAEPCRTSLCPTPLLHFLVRCKNDPKYGTASEEGYYCKLLTAFEDLWKLANANDLGNYVPEVSIDSANGVGVVSLQKAVERLHGKVKVNVYNDDIVARGKLNFQCGADYVKLRQTFPDNVPRQTNARCVSFDGDADRILYYYADDSGKFHLMDGDRMATLIVMFLKELVNEAGLEVSFGIVQTAYANGNSTRYINEHLKVDVCCVKTGVKHLHMKALQYDIGVYFEANGHGTAVFSDKLRNELEHAIAVASGKRLKALTTLRTFVDVTNETIGDAFSDWLIVEAILHAKGWSLRDWEALYDDLPNQQVKVTIKDRNLITTINAERQVLTPEGLQRKIDSLVAEFQSARSFVRPSGTEDIVRVYAEAATITEAKDLALKVSRLVYDMAGGVGTRP